MSDTHYHYCPGCSYDYKCREPCEAVIVEDDGTKYGMGWPCSPECREKIRLEDEEREREARIQWRRRETLRRLSDPAKPKLSDMMSWAGWT